MPGYANRFKRLEFPELGEGIFVTIRNVKTMTSSRLQPETIPMDGNGNPLDMEQAEASVNKVLASLVTDWHVYDATSDEEDQPVLGLPATPEDMAKLPVEITTAIVKEMASAVNPR